MSIVIFPNVHGTTYFLMRHVITQGEYSRTEFQLAAERWEATSFDDDKATRLAATYHGEVKPSAWGR